MLIVCFLGMVKPRKIRRISFLKKGTIVLLKKYYRFHEKVVSFSKRPTIVIFFPISGFFREDII